MSQPALPPAAPQEGNPVICRGKSRQDIKGLMTQGTAKVYSSPEETLRYAREAAMLRGVPEPDLPAELGVGAVYIKVAPE